MTANSPSPQAVSLRECPHCNKAEGLVLLDLKVWCPGCKAYGPAAGSRKDAIAAWNRRASPADGVVVPLEPTPEMIANAVQHIGGGSTFDAEDRQEIALDIYRAMLAASPALAATSGGEAVSVWYGAMPESNGRSNWTASLHRKGGGIHTEGFCFARSEYPDRVRYEADRVRWIIGELAERPDILAYDADLHSGYVSPPSPDADKLDAERFRALMRCGRIKMQGSSGVDPHTLERNGNNVHFGAEFWPEPYEPDKWETTYGQSTRWGRACLRHLADAVIENEALARLSTTEAGG